MADLDDDEQLVDEVGVGVMAVYLKAIHDRLKAEVGAGNPNGPQRASVNVWLLPLLKEDHVCWRLSAAMARMVCGKLGLKYGEPAYYRDVVIWLPDLRWGDDGLPPCPECHCRRVGPHMFRENHDGRRICGLTEHYFILSRRCHRYPSMGGQSACSSARLCSTLSRMILTPWRSSGVVMWMVCAFSPRYQFTFEPTSLRGSAACACVMLCGGRPRVRQCSKLSMRGLRGSWRTVPPHPFLLRLPPPHPLQPLHPLPTCPPPRPGHSRGHLSLQCPSSRSSTAPCRSHGCRWQCQLIRSRLWGV